MGKERKPTVSPREFKSQSVLKGTHLLWQAPAESLTNPVTVSPPMASFLSLVK